MDDEPTGSIETDLSVSVGSSVTGTIEAEGDVDFYTVTLEAGVSYQIDMEGSRTGEGTLSDPFFTGLFTSDGSQLVGADDDGGVRSNSRIVFTPEESGIYFIGLSSFDNVSLDDIGTYTLFVEEEALSLRPDPVDVELSGLPGINHVDPIVAGIRFTPDDDDITRITYSYPTVSSQFLVPFELDDVDITPTFRPADSDTIRFFEDALVFTEEVANIEFTEVSDIGTQFGVIRLAANTGSFGNTAGVARLPGELLEDGDLFIFEDRLGSSSLTQYVVIHEFAHTLGLVHPDEGNIIADPQFQGVEFTVMASSLTSSFFTDAVSANLYPSTLGYLDILALRFLYGDNDTVFAGDDTYVFDIGDRYFMTIFDLGGNDTIQITGGAENVFIDLTPDPDNLNGAFIDVGTTVTYFGSIGQTVGQLHETVYVSPETTIENVITSGGDDVLVGGDIDNRLESAGGDDTLRGSGGNDRLSAGAGDDVLDGGSGDDFLSGNEGDDIAIGQEGDDRIFGGSGDNGDDIFIGGSGDDDIGGAAGDDLLVGGGFNDGSTQHLSISPESDDGDGIDRLYGADGNDTVIGGGWDDSLVDDNGRFDVGEQVVIGTDANELWAGEGDDLVYGAAGDDLLGGRGGSDTLNGGAGDDTIFGGAGDGADYVSGGNGADVLFSGGGNDTVFGGTGDDEIYDAAGNDTYTGGSGADVFYFSSGAGEDVVKDFEVGEDTLSLAATTAVFSSSQDVFNAAMATSQNGSEGVVINTGGGDSVFLHGLVQSDLLHIDYIFV